MRSLQQQNRSVGPRSVSRPVGLFRRVPKVSCRVTTTKTNAPADTTSSSSTKTLQPTQAPQQQTEKPYRVTQTTIDDIQAFHKSQLNEYDYIVQDDWVRGLSKA